MMTSDMGTLDPTDEHAVAPGAPVVRLDLTGTAVFLVALGIAVPLRTHRFAQFLIGGVSMVLFAIGVATTIRSWSASQLAVATCDAASRAPCTGQTRMANCAGSVIPGRYRWLTR